MAVTRHIATAEVISVGTELTTGATRDTNAGELARELTAMGLLVSRITGIRDDLSAVSDAFSAAIARAHLIVSSGGLGPTPDDLTREAIAAATGLELRVDRELEHWLRELFRRRGLEMPESNLKQAWLVPGATGLPNDYGTAPGWWLELADGRVVVALPGPPREMWPMWQAQVRPRLAERNAGVEVAHETLRLAGIGESALVGLIGEVVLRGHDPQVATYSRPDAVDVRVSARGAGAADRVAAAVAALLPRLEPYVFARGTETWPDALARLLGDRTLATVEIGTAGRLLDLLGGAPFLLRGELATDDRPLAELADAARRSAAADIGLAVRATAGDVDTQVDLLIATSAGTHADQRTAFLAGPEGQRRTALAACAGLWQWLRAESGGDAGQRG